jgi:hypothetical protein
MKQKLIRAIHALRKEFQYYPFKLCIYKDADEDFCIFIDAYFENIDRNSMTLKSNEIIEIAKNVFVTNRYKLPFPSLHVRVHVPESSYIDS